MTYKGEITRAMNILAEEENSIFVGQSIVYPGSIMSSSLSGVPNSKKIEFPLIEDAQMGMSIGLSLEGYLPVSIYPRMDFLVLAINQMVNHLDKIEEMSCGRFRPKVIIRTAVGSTKPLYPGLQHCSDYTGAFQALFKNINVVKLLSSREIIPAYRRAIADKRSTLLIEMANLYSSE